MVIVVVMKTVVVVCNGGGGNWADIVMVEAMVVFCSDDGSFL